MLLLSVSHCLFTVLHVLVPRHLTIYSRESGYETDKVKEEKENNINAKLSKGKLNSKECACFQELTSYGSFLVSTKADCVKC